MKLFLTQASKKQLKHLSKIDQLAISKKIKDLKDDSLIGEQKLSSYKNTYRVRVGNFRIVYKKIKDEATIILIRHRKDVYEMLKQILG